MIRLRVKDILEKRGYNLARFTRDVRPLEISRTSARRLWFSSSSGVPGDRLHHVDLDVLDKLARWMEVDARELFEQVPDK